MLNRVDRLLKLLKGSKIKLFDTELMKDVDFHGALQNTERSVLHFGLKIKSEHCNVHMSLHGGAYSTLVDCMTTLHAWSLDPESRIAISVELGVSFYSSALIDQYLDIYTDIVSIDKSFAKATAGLYVNKNVIGRGNHTLFFLNKSVNDLANLH